MSSSLVKSKEVVNKMDKEVCILRQTKRKSHKFKFAKYCSECTLGMDSSSNVMW